MAVKIPHFDTVLSLELIFRLLFFVDESNSSSKHDYLYSVSLDGNSLRKIKKFDLEKKKLSHSIYHTLKRYDLSIHYERERIFWVRSSESVIESASIGEFYKRSKIFI